MNKQDIYYTPGVEEFHDGFVYEEKCYYINTSYINNREELVVSTRQVYDLGMCTQPVTEVWIPKVYKLGDLIHKTRVKYLDDEDLEDCGFTVVGMPWQYFDGIHMLVDLNHNMIRIDHVADEQCLFYGEIKNKSEFKKLLKQLDIQYD